jgi:tight adherence protein B
MVLGLIIPIMMLLAVPIVAVSVLKTDGHGRKLEARVSGVVLPVQAAAVEAPAPKLRLVEARGGSVSLALRRLVQMPENLPEARKMPVPVVFIIAALMGSGTVVFMHLYLSLFLGVPIGILVALLFMRSVFVSEVRKYGRRLRKQMPDMIELVVSATLAGLPVAEGFSGVSREMGSPTKEEFQRITRDLALGVSLEEAMMRLFRRTQVAEYAIFAVTLGVQSRSGGKLSEVIMRLADTIRQRTAIAERASAMAAEAKLSAYVLSVLPFFGAGIMAAIQPGFVGPLLHDPRGQHLIFIGGVAMILGWFTMKHMITTATSE